MVKYIGVNDHDIDLFEGQYIVPNGMAYNSYIIEDEKIAIMDTVDASFGEEWLGISRGRWFGGSTRWCPSVCLSRSNNPLL